MKANLKELECESDVLRIYTDGSCLGNPGAGGWAVLIMFNEDEVVLKGGALNTTNNRMEMTAVLKALEWLVNNFKRYLKYIKIVEINSDSNLVVQTILKGWKRKANLDLWEKIDSLLLKLVSNKVNLNWKWVKGHSSNEYNELVDRMAVAEAKKKKKQSGKEDIKPENNDMFFCNRCGSETKGKLSYMKKSGLIRVDCTKCGKFIKFAKKTPKNIKRAKLK
jgi:ribonuclease HI